MICVAGCHAHSWFCRRAGSRPIGIVVQVLNFTATWERGHTKSLDLVLDLADGVCSEGVWDHVDRRKKLLKKIVLDQETCIQDSCFRFLARRSEPLHACPQLSDFKAFQLQKSLKRWVVLHQASGGLQKIERAL